MKNSGFYKLKEHNVPFKNKPNDNTTSVKIRIQNIVLQSVNEEIIQLAKFKKSLGLESFQNSIGDSNNEEGNRQVINGLIHFKRLKIDRYNFISLLTKCFDCFKIIYNFN